MTQRERERKGGEAACTHTTSNKLLVGGRKKQRKYKKKDLVNVFFIYTTDKAAFVHITMTSSDSLDNDILTGATAPQNGNCRTQW